MKLTRKLWYHPESENLFMTFDGKHPGGEFEDVTGIEKFEKRFVLSNAYPDSDNDDSPQSTGDDGYF